LTILITKQRPMHSNSIQPHPLQATLMPYATVRATALATVQNALRRFPCLAPAVLPSYLSAVAGVPSPPAAARLMLAGSPADAEVEEATIAEFYEGPLREAALREQQTPAAAAAEAAAGGGKGAAPAAEESANDGRVAGACSGLSGSIELLRHCFREPGPWAALLRAALASRVHGSAACEDALGGLLMQVRGRGLNRCSGGF
jgi:hypothetical protein